MTRVITNVRESFAQTRIGHNREKTFKNKLRAYTLLHQRTVCDHNYL